MLNIKVNIKRDKYVIANQLVLCPQCKQKLTDVLSVLGRAELRIKCRRCGTFVNIELEENTAG